MARQGVISSMCAMAWLLVAGIIASIPSVESLGVCYGMSGSDLPPATSVIAMYKSNGIKAMRLYCADKPALEALNGTDIRVLVNVPNDVLSNLSTRRAAAAAWVRDNIEPYHPSVVFRYIAVGNEVAGDAAINFLLPAIENVQSAITDAGLDKKMKVTTSVSQAIVDPCNLPSDGKFSKEAHKFMGPILKFISRNGAPLMVNVYPYFTYAYNPGDMDVRYALFTAPDTVVKDGKYMYQNLFDATVDSFYAAMAREGVTGVKVLVSESGWPSAGGKAASPENARIYNQNLIDHVRKGTPRQPHPIKTYLFSMFNENQKAKGVERNWGLFYPNMKPVYPISFKRSSDTTDTDDSPAPAPTLAPARRGRY
ncbi:hypothetical protein HU200_040720 [Digitaria exilis]|uniref:Beta-1,3-glucanase n=1 Tax=Digitaria exilis TaxID=1010633 RepID=A0A835EEE1_9POAL|nr:hypothetical protein HU200_040720 [Digitaria exilis]